MLYYTGAVEFGSSSVEHHTPVYSIVRLLITIKRTRHNIFPIVVTTIMAASDAPPVVDDDDAPVPLKQRTQPHLMPQDAKTVDPSKLTALSPEVVSRHDCISCFMFEID